MVRTRRVLSSSEAPLPGLAVVDQVAVFVPKCPENRFVECRLFMSIIPNIGWLSSTCEAALSDHELSIREPGDAT